MSKFKVFFSNNKFNIISWLVTLIVAVGLVFGALAWKQSTSTVQALAPQPTTAPDAAQPNIPMPALSAPETVFQAIARNIQLKTNIPVDRPRYDPVYYRVERGDALFSIAKEFNLKPETILYSNKDTLNDDPHSLSPGMQLVIPPIDGLYYTWKSKDTVDLVAKEFKTNADDILYFPGNKLDVTDPKIPSGTLVMIPGGKRELIDWASFIPTVSRGKTGAGTGTSNIGTQSCNGGPVGSGFIWPTNGPHTLSGNDYGPAHLGIDISAPAGTPILAASAGVVVIAQGGYNYGYGNFIEIDHGNGYATIYAHLSQINVSVCQGVGAGQLIGLAGSTGNSTGSHLHFEIRNGGANINPWELLQ